MLSKAFKLHTSLNECEQNIKNQYLRHKRFIPLHMFGIIWEHPLVPLNVLGGGLALLLEAMLRSAPGGLLMASRIQRRNKDLCSLPEASSWRTNKSCYLTVHSNLVIQNILKSLNTMDERKEAYGFKYDLIPKRLWCVWVFATKWVFNVQNIVCIRWNVSFWPIWNKIKINPYSWHFKHQLKGNTNAYQVNAFVLGVNKCIYVCI